MSGMYASALVLYRDPLTDVVSKCGGWFVLWPCRDWYKSSTQLASLRAYARKTQAEYLDAMRGSSQSARQACAPPSETL